MTRRRGFTLIELLVVIAIIGILAAMLFPVFARARESARKTQCLANVKNIAIAINMYLTDYDRLPPHSAATGEEEAFFDSIPGGRTGRDSCGGWGPRWKANPYLRWHVILEDYIKNRDVWRCPSAKVINTPAFILPDYGGGPWWKYLQAHVGEWGYHTDAGGPCSGGGAYPPGWGGTVTDSIRQQAEAGESTGAAQFGVSYSNQWLDLSMSQVQDPSWFMVVGDVCYNPYIWTAASSFYEFCGADYTNVNDDGSAGGCYGCEVADWVNCPDTVDCGVPKGGWAKWRSDASWRKKYTRHLGGSNLGFLDGHAKWFPADQAMSEVPWCEPCADETGGNTYYIHREDKPLIGFCPVD